MLPSYKLRVIKKTIPMSRYIKYLLNTLVLFQVFLSPRRSPTFFSSYPYIDTHNIIVFLGTYLRCLPAFAFYFLLLCCLLCGRDWVLLAFKIAFRKCANCLESSRMMLHSFLTVIEQDNKVTASTSSVT